MTLDEYFSPENIEKRRYASELYLKAVLDYMRLFSKYLEQEKQKALLVLSEIENRL